jgi:hypothetical protein
MNVVTSALELYLAATLGVSGLTKAEHPEKFAMTLRQHGILPTWSVPAVSRVVPWLEMAIAGSLLAGVASVLVAALALALFVSFLAVKILLVSRGRATDCGCYGSAHFQKVDGASISVSAIFVLLATFHLWAVRQHQLAWVDWRLSGVAIFSTAACWAHWSTVRRRRRGPRASASRSMAAAVDLQSFLRLGTTGDEAARRNFGYELASLSPESAGKSGGGSGDVG